MNRSEILNKIIEVCNDVFDDVLVQITDDTLLVEDLGCDSLKKLIFINELENVFSITFKLDDSINMSTISDVIDIVELNLRG